LTSFFHVDLSREEEKKGGKETGRASLRTRERREKPTPPAPSFPSTISGKKGRKEGKSLFSYFIGKKRIRTGPLRRSAIRIRPEKGGGKGGREENITHAPSFPVKVQEEKEKGLSVISE